LIKKLAPFEKFSSREEDPTGWEAIWPSGPDVKKYFGKSTKRNKPKTAKILMDEMENRKIAAA